MGGGAGGFNVNFDGTGGFGGGGFEQMFGGMGGMGGGGQRGGRQRGRGQGQQQAQELFPKNSPSGIAPLGKAKFPGKTSKYMWVVVFYDNNSQACASVKPQLESFAGKVKGTFKVGAVNCRRSQADMDFCRQQGIDVQNLPAFGFVVDGEIHMHERIGTNAPSMKLLHDFAVENVPFDRVQMVNHPFKIDEKLLDPSKKGKMIGSILLLTDKYETSPKYVSLAYQFRDHFTFGESRGKTLSMAKHFHVKKYPLLVAFVANSRGEFESVMLEDVKSQDLEKWVDKLVTKHSSKKRRR